MTQRQEIEQVSFESPRETVVAVDLDAIVDAAIDTCDAWADDCVMGATVAAADAEFTGAPLAPRGNTQR